MNRKTRIHTKIVRLAAFGVLASVAASSASASGDWPRWRGPAGDGTLHSPGLPLVLDDDQVQRLWQADVGGGYSGITVASGLAYTMDRPNGENAERILCFDAESGKLAWEHRYDADYDGLDYGSGPRASVTIHEGRAYALGASGNLHCLDARSGALVWARDTMKDLGAARPTWGFAASPVIFRDMVIAHVGVPGGSYVAFDLATGDERWRGSDDPAGYATPVLTRHQDRDLMICWTPEHIQGLDPASGTVHWSIPYPMKYGVSIATPIVHDGIVLVCGYWHGSKAIRLGESGNEAALLWEDIEDIRGLMAQPLHRDGIVYLLDRSNGLTAFELATGRRLWDDSENHALTPADRNPQATLVWVRDEESPDAPTNRALAFNANGELLSLTLSPEGFTIHSRVQVTGKTWAHPAYANGRIFARTDREIVACHLGGVIGRVGRP